MGAGRTDRCRSWFDPERVLVTGAGPIGLLAALLGRQRGLDVHVLDRVTKGPKPRLVHALGAAYHPSDMDDVIRRTKPDVVVGSVNANRRHYAQAAEALARADPDWLGRLITRLITRRLPLADFEEAFEAREDDVKVVPDLSR